MSSCALCNSCENLSDFQVTPPDDNFPENNVVLCDLCFNGIENFDSIEVEHWRCLNDSMWSPNAGVQVLAWRLLQQLNQQGWAQNLLEMLYLEDDVLAWAKAGSFNLDDEQAVIHKDCNGVVLAVGDSVTVIKDLNVKGSSVVAKRGTVVRRISLNRDNAEQIEGRVDGQQIVILTKFVKKS